MIFEYDAFNIIRFMFKETTISLPYEYIRLLALMYNTSFWQYTYCKQINDNEEMWKALAKNSQPEAAEWQYTYCANIKDREEMWKAVARSNDPFWLYLYLTNIKDRPEIVNALAKAPYNAYHYNLYLKEREGGLI